jgi:mannosyltransferase OCH1-like enzyme
MTPKILHLCWLSGDEYPPLIKKCVDSWKEKCPCYEIKIWSTTTFDMGSSLWVQQAFEKKKYAFAAGYIHFWAVYSYGGIYLDSDVEVIKNFDDSLHL